MSSFADHFQDFSTAHNSSNENLVDDSLANIGNPNNAHREANTVDSKENNQAQGALETSIDLNLSWSDFLAPGKCIFTCLIYALNHNSVQFAFVCGKMSKEWFDSFEWLSEKCCMKFTILCRR